MKKTAFVVVLIFAILFSVAGVQFVGLVGANAYLGWQVIDPPPGTIPPKITILNPKTNTTYPGGILNVTGIVAKPEGDYTAKGAHFTVEYFLNGGSPIPRQSYDFLTSEGVFSAVISGWGSGSNELEVQVLCTIVVETRIVFEMRSSSTVFFTVDVAPPVISGLSVENKTYNEFDLPLDFTVDEPTSWMGYNLDNGANVTISGNSTLALKGGFHSIVVYANDTAGNMVASETIYFAIEDPFLTSIVIASVIPVAVVLVGLGLLLYKIKKR